MSDEQTPPRPKYTSRPEFGAAFSGERRAPPSRAVPRDKPPKPLPTAVPAFPLPKPKRAKRVPVADTATLQAGFLIAYRETGVIRYAAEAVPVDSTTVYEWMKQPEFKARFDIADKDATDYLKQAARDRAVHGRKPSDLLLLRLLEAKAPDEFKASHRLGLGDGVPPPAPDMNTIGRTPEELSRQAAEEIARMAQADPTLLERVRSLLPTPPGEAPHNEAPHV